MDDFNNHYLKYFNNPWSDDAKRPDLPKLDHMEHNHAVRWAPKNGHLEVIKYLASQEGVDVNIDSNYAIRLTNSLDDTPPKEN